MRAPSRSRGAGGCSETNAHGTPNQPGLYCALHKTGGLHQGDCTGMAVTQSRPTLEATWTATTISDIIR